MGTLNPPCPVIRPFAHFQSCLLDQAKTLQPYLRILLQTNHPLRLRPPKPFRHLHSHLPQHLLHPVPIDAPVPRVPIRRRLLIIADPIVGNDARVIVAHDALAQIIDAVLVVALVHVWHGLFRSALFREVVAVGKVVVLPEVVQAVEVVGAAGDGNVAARGQGAHRGREADGGGVGVLARERDGGGGGGDGAEGCVKDSFVSAKYPLGLSKPRNMSTEERIHPGMF